MSYVFSFSDALTSAVRMHMENGNRVAVMKLVDHSYVVNSGLADRGFQILCDAAAKTKMRLPTVWAVDIGNIGKNPIHSRHLLFYADNPGEILEKLHALPIKKKVDPPRATVVKMTVKRIKAILKDVRYHNSWVDKYGKKTCSPQKKIKIPACGLITIALVDELIDTLIKTSGSNVYSRDITQSIKDYEYDLKKKKKKNFDDSVVKEAWNLILVEEIHNS